MHSHVPHRYIDKLMHQENIASALQPLSALSIVKNENLKLNFLNYLYTCLKGRLVAVKKPPTDKVELTRDMLVELRDVSS